MKSTLVTIPINGRVLEGELAVAPAAKGLVIFTHGSGSSRHSPRNKFVAEQLQAVGVGTLLVDLLTEEEDADYQARFDIDRLAQRLLAITAWVVADSRTRNLPLGYFGASTGAAAAIIAAARLPKVIRAVVSRGGRVDLAGDAAGDLTAPTLLIVGGKDKDVLALNKTFQEKIKAQNHLVVVPGASHLFEEPGALESVAAFAREWLIDYLAAQFYYNHDAAEE